MGGVGNKYREPMQRVVQVPQVLASCRRRKKRGGGGGGEPVAGWGCGASFQGKRPRRVAVLMVPGTANSAPVLARVGMPCGQSSIVP